MPREMSRLLVDEIMTVGFVDKGDDPEAEIVFYKRRDEPKSEGVMDTIKNFLRALGLKSGMDEDEVEKLLADGADGGSDNDDGSNKDGEGHMTFDVNKLDEEARAAFDAAVEEAVKQRLEKGGDEGDDLPPDLPEGVAKRFDEMQEAIEKAQERAEAAEKRAAQLEDHQEAERYIQKVKRLALPGTNPDDFSTILRKAEAALEGEELEKFNDFLKSTSQAIKESHLYKELGGGGQAPTTVEAQADAIAKEYQEKDPNLSEQEARGMVWKNHPKLYDEYRRERSARTVED